MKKNLLTIVILALVIANLILNGIMVFSTMPAMKKTNALITQISSAIDLELESGELDQKVSVPMEQIETYNLTDSITVNLKLGADGVDHFAVLSITLSMDTKDDGYKTFKGAEGLAAKEGLIRDEIINILSECTIEELKSGKKELQDTMTSRLQSMFDSTFIIGVAFGDIKFQ